MEVCGLREGFSLRDYQTLIVSETLKEFEEKSRQNVFISLPQGTGKTITALAALSKLINENKVKKVLVLIPRRVLVNQCLHLKKLSSSKYKSFCRLRSARRNLV